MRTYEFKLYTTDHVQYLSTLLGIAQKTYNHFCDLCYIHYRLFVKHLGLKCLSLGTQTAKLQKHLTKLKRSSYYSWMNGLNAQSLQNVIDGHTHNRDLNAAKNIEHEGCSLI